ncbi:hypothetical protein KP509_02G054200 [Ceratopteris richardii]|nr:hypothetical protein KP509_02G054200 [Ceratopteris richardii]
MYAKCGDVAKAEKLFGMYRSRDVFTWTALIAGYAHQGQGQQSLHHYEHMRREGLTPDEVTFNCVLKACAMIAAIDKGVQIHDDISKHGFLQKNVMLGNSLVNMYAKCGALTRAEKVLEELPIRNVITWSALIAGYAEHQKGEQAFECFQKMQREGLVPDAVTFISLLKVCGSSGFAGNGELIHEEISKHGLLGSDSALDNALIDMYVKCGALDKAREVLDELPNRDVISWCTLIAGYGQKREGEKALQCFTQLLREGIHPNSVTYTCILKACCGLGAATEGEKLHDVISKQGLLSTDIFLGNALINMYAKCGFLVKAAQVMAELPNRDVISWNTMMTGYIQKGECEQALASYEKLHDEGLSPDATTFLCVLTACSRLGLVDVAYKYFETMIKVYGIMPCLQHYTCIVDLFGRAGQLQKAVELMRRLPFSDTVVWSALLGACQKWGDVSIGRWVFDHGIQSNKKDAALYISRENTYSDAGLLHDADCIEFMCPEIKA